MFAVTNAIPVDVIIGVDTHKDVHAAAAISGAGVPSRHHHRTSQ